MLELPALVSPRREIKHAPAIAMDLGTFESGAKEEGGHIYTIQDLVREAVGEQIRFRTLRIVNRRSDAWGEKDDVVDTTEKDEEVKVDMMAHGGVVAPWYGGAGLSPAILVMEPNVEALPSSDKTIVIPERAQIGEGGPEIQTPSVVEILERGGFDRDTLSLFLFEPLHPTAALPRAGMSPEEVVEHMRKVNIHSRVTEIDIW